MKCKTINIGDTVTAIFPWREDELPSGRNFLTGEVLGIRSGYVEIEGAERPVPLDRIVETRRKGPPQSR